eukprot:1795152-Pyramimonas_sp.AAC.1
MEPLVAGLARLRSQQRRSAGQHGRGNNTTQRNRTHNMLEILGAVVMQPHACAQPTAIRDS